MNVSVCGVFVFFLCGVRGSQTLHYYILFLPTELSSQGFYLYTLSGCQTFLFVHKTFQLLCIVVFLYATWIVIEYSVVWINLTVVYNFLYTCLVAYHLTRKSLTAPFLASVTVDFLCCLKYVKGPCNLAHFLFLPL